MLTWEELDKPHEGLLARYVIIRRGGAEVPFGPKKLSDAMVRAFLAVRGFTDRNAQGQLPAIGCSDSYPTCQVERRPDPVGMGGWIKQHLYSLFKTQDWTAKVCAAKSSGFFSASKTNLRNAP